MSEETKFVNIRFKAEDYERITEAANKKGLTAGPFIRMVVLEEIDEPEVVYGWSGPPGEKVPRGWTPPRIPDIGPR